MDNTSGTAVHPVVPQGSPTAPGIQNPTSAEVIRHAFDAHAAVVGSTFQTLAPGIERAGQLLVETLKRGGIIAWAGNGGSAADAQHLAAELIGRFKKERGPLASIALTTDTSILTCVGNDYGYDQVFSRQVQGLLSAKDILVVISTSGNSPNVLEAVKVARAKGITVIGLLGRDGGKLRDEVTLPLVVPARETAQIQEMHILIGHTLCHLLDFHFN